MASTPSNMMHRRTPVVGDQSGGTVLVAPAKLTVSLRIAGVRPDGYHLIDAEMVTVDLWDELVVSEGDGLQIVDQVVGQKGVGTLGVGRDNLVNRALDAVGRRCRVRLVKRIPTQAGLGGGSADAAAILRWAGVSDNDQAAALGADVPFCLIGGRARVQGVGEKVTPLPFEARCYVLLLPPIGVDTAGCYRMWDALSAKSDERLSMEGEEGKEGVANDLEAAALALVPELGVWRDAFAAACGRRPSMAGSGSTWFVEGTPGELGLAEQEHLVVGDQKAALVAVHTVPNADEGFVARADADFVAREPAG